MDYDLEETGADTKKLALESLNNTELFNELIKGIRSKDKTVRNNSFNALMVVAEKNGDLLYPKWDYIHEMLISNNSNEQYVAIYLLANLTASDTENKFETIFDDYFNILGGEKTLPASHVILNSGKLIENKPELRSEIISKLLSTDETFKGRQNDLLKVYVIETLRKIPSDPRDKTMIEKFIKSQLNSSSSRTRSAAKCYVDRCFIDL
jgi:dimeric dUTPase (all-alpha-NTP-PPase superfamily)